jgi:hypothetical protein
MTAPNQTKTLLEDVFLMVCTDEDMDILSPWWENGSLYFTDGRILIVLDNCEPVAGIHCRVQEDGKWVFFDTRIPCRKPPQSVPQFLREAIRDDFAETPVVDKPARTDLRWRGECTCDTCGGSVQVRCNYGHWHDCVDCEDGTQIEVVAEAYEPIEFVGVKFAKRYLWTATQMPNVRISKPIAGSLTESKPATGFTFDGGRGAIMPMA